MERDLTEGQPFSVLLRFTLPVIGGNLFQLFYTLADTVIVGRTLGADALAAVGATSTVVYFVLCFIQGFTGGFGICLGQRHGAHNEVEMRRSIAVSWGLSLLFTVVLTLICGLFSHSILHWVQTPSDVYSDAYDYMFIVLMGTGATVFYNMISNMLRAMSDSKTPLVVLVFSALLNVILDIVFIVPLNMGVAGAAWATVLSQLIAGVLCTIIGIKRFRVLRIKRTNLTGWKKTAAAHLRIGLPMGFQLSVMCIGVLAMQVAVNALGSTAITGYTAATKVDQFSALINNAFGIAISNYVAQNYGAGKYERIQSGVRASLLQTECANIFMCVLLLLCRNSIMPLFIEAPTKEISWYANGFLLTVAPFYLLLGVLIIYRTTIQSWGDSRAPFVACIIELVARVAATWGLSQVLGYIGICLATPIAWLGAVLLLVPVYRSEMRGLSLHKMNAVQTG